MADSVILMLPRAMWENRLERATAKNHATVPPMLCLVRLTLSGSTSYCCAESATRAQPLLAC
jgi:hypothetical protein